MLPITQPPPWKYSMMGSAPVAPRGLNRRRRMLRPGSSATMSSVTTLSGRGGIPSRAKPSISARTSCGWRISIGGSHAATMVEANSGAISGCSFAAIIRVVPVRWRAHPARAEAAATSLDFVYIPWLAPLARYAWFGHAFRAPTRFARLPPSAARRCSWLRRGTVLRQLPRAAWRGPHGRSGELREPAWAIRLGEDHDAAADRGLRAADGRPHPDRRARHDRRACPPPSRWASCSRTWPCSRI